MKTTYLKCSHGVEKRSFMPCQQCEKEQSELFKGIARTIQEDKRIPILRGCSAAESGGCYCTGKCKEVIGYHEPE